ncbi:MAG: aminoacyl-tRNA hydrolase [Candidatus Omnitrophica bacterium]|nr:aminoacyl-tRNA hydrolase [Candidatus Omnitrophota bacterium]
MSDISGSENSYLIVGLGNPGSQYEYTRHNMGCLVLEYFAERLKLKFQASSFTKAVTALGQWEGKQVCLVFPTTFMNNSGTAVRRMTEKYAPPLEHILVICDDFNLPFGQLRLRSKGSGGGHNGLESVIEHLGSQDFPRLRMGIGEPKGTDVADYVLEEFNSSEKKGLKEFITEAGDCLEMWIKEGISKTMETHNRRKGNGK